MKKLIAFGLAFVLLTTPLSACSQAQKPAQNDKVQVVCTFFPQYDWARQIIGNTSEVELTLLVDNGVDLHSFQPSAADIAAIAACDLFIYVGGESDEWVEGVLRSAHNENMTVIKLMDVVGDSLKNEELSEGMQDEDGHKSADHAPDEDAAVAPGAPRSYKEASPDEHVWLSLKNAEKISWAIADALSELDSAGASTYQAHALDYAEKLALLDEDYRDLVQSAFSTTLLFGDRFPFRYLVDDYAISYYAAFPGCSSETAASFDTIIKLAGIVDKLDLHTVMVCENSDRSLAQAIINNTAKKDQEIFELDSMQSVSADDIAQQVSYLSIAQSNYEVLKKVLNS